jgi:hypothetical protein
VLTLTLTSRGLYRQAKGPYLQPALYWSRAWQYYSPY